MSKVLITGAAGFIGAHLSQILAQSGHEVVGIDSYTPYYSPDLKRARVERLATHPAIQILNGDITHEEFLKSVLQQHRFSAVIHLAAQPGVRYSFVDPHSYITNNYLATFSLLNAFKEKPLSQFFIASSSSVYGNADHAPFTVATHNTDHPVSLYAATKKGTEVLAHTYAHCYQMPITALRFFTVYGPWGRPDMAIYTFTEKLMSGDPIDLYDAGKPLRDYTYVDDIVTAIAKLLEAPREKAFEIYNIGNNQPESVADLLCYLQDLTGKQANVLNKPLPPGDVYKTCADIQPLFNRIGFRPQTPLKKGLENFWQWYKDYSSL